MTFGQISFSSVVWWCYTPPHHRATQNDLRSNKEINKMEIGLAAIGAGLAVGLAAIGTGLAQARIGSAGAGVIAEKPEALGTIILLVAIPETMVILGFAVAAMILLLGG
jgi:V/A-type H+/Na+-transporting ATPase subunit K